MMRRDTDATECDWLAFLYISDEMSAAERLRFEERLAGDLQAQSALAEMVGLTAGILAARPNPEPQAHSQPQPRTSPVMRRKDSQIVILVACACLALLAAVLPATIPPAVAPKAVVRSTGHGMTGQQAGELVDLWSAGGAVDVSWELTDPTALESDGPDVLLSDDLNVPGWLLSAVSRGDTGPLREIE